MLDDRSGVSELLELATRHVVVWIVNGLSLEALQLGHPVADIVAVRIAFFGLGEGVEYSLK